MIILVRLFILLAAFKGVLWVKQPLHAVCLGIGTALSLSILPPVLALVLFGVTGVTPAAFGMGLIMDLMVCVPAFLLAERDLGAASWFAVVVITSALAVSRLPSELVLKLF